MASWVRAGDGASMKVSTGKATSGRCQRVARPCSPDEFIPWLREVTCELLSSDLDMLAA